MNMTTIDRTANRRRASTAEILGNSSVRQKIDPRWEKYYQQLMKAREAMIRHKGDLAESAREELPHFSLHIGDAGTDQYDLDFTLSMMSADQDALYEIDEALSRIRSGTYGICEISGQPIEAERLEAIPWTRFSLEAQRTVEEQGGASRTHFAKRHSLLEMESTEAAEDDDDSE